MTLFCLLLFLSSCKNSNESIQITKHSTHEIKKNEARNLPNITMLLPADENGQTVRKYIAEKVKLCSN
jgi:hypothetical protein